MKRFRHMLIFGSAVMGFSSTVFPRSSSLFKSCIDAQDRFKVYDYHQTGEYSASVLAQIDGDNFALFCGLSDDPADVIPVACAGNNGDTIVSLRIHQISNTRPRAAVIGVRERGDTLDINSVVPLVCD